ncbi:hypothetical protein F383_18732 [Gossypium arboreum]|uniref:Uncharacterized protein n=1 Tax=Gossypium arboreum TaxID=29729 RepID=A0A0B0NP01_GOSAR|nr:hypothetical protein F383_18732 [Gossypium arboreum]
MKSVCSIWSHTQACDWPYGTSQYTP